MVTVKLFGIAKEIVGGSTLTLDRPVANVEELLAYLRELYPDFARLTSLLIAVNNEYAQPATAISDSDEIAVIPPVSGG